MAPAVLTCPGNTYIVVDHIWCDGCSSRLRLGVESHSRRFTIMWVLPSEAKNCYGNFLKKQFVMKFMNFFCVEILEYIIRIWKEPLKIFVKKSLKKFTRQFLKEFLKNSWRNIGTNPKKIKGVKEVSWRNSWRNTRMIHLERLFEKPLLEYLIKPLRYL